MDSYDKLLKPEKKGQPTTGIFEQLSAPPQPPPSLEPSYQPRPKLEPEYAPAFHVWRASPTPENARKLVETVKPILDTATKPLGHSANLQAQARHVAIKALAGYEPTRASLRTHLLSHLQGLRRYAGQQDSPIRVPERFILQHHALRSAEAEFRDREGRDPSDTELAEETHLAPKRIAALRRWHRPLAEGHLSTPDEEGESADPAVQWATPADVLHEFIYTDLSPRDQLIMDHALGRNGREKLPSKAIAARAGVTPGFVSQRLAAIQQRLNAVEDMKLFGG